MNPNKSFIIDELYERVNASPFVIVVDYTGTSVPQFSLLRDKLRESGAECHVAKNTYMRAALTKAGLPDLASDLIGQTAFITGDEDVCAAARAVKEFAKDAAKKDVFKAGILDGDVLDAAKLTTLSSLPSRDALLSMLLGVINEPGTQIARVLNAKFNPDADDSSTEEAAAE